MSDIVRVGSLALHRIEPASPTRPAALFLHGILAAGWIFEPWLAAFSARGYPSYALDLRGHGDSPSDRPIGSVRLRDFVDDATAAARSLVRDGQPPIVVGHSMGGLLAQRLAERGLARSMVLVGSAPPRGINLLTWRLVRRMTRYMGAMLFSRPLVARAADLDDLSLNAVRPDQRAVLVARLGPESGRAARELTLGGLAVDAALVKCPVLILSGDADHFIPLRMARAIARRYAAQCVVLPGHAHMPMREPGGDGVAARILDWLESPAGRG